MKKLLFVLLLIPSISNAQEDAFSLEASGADNLEEGTDIGDDRELKDDELDAILSGMDEEEEAEEDTPPASSETQTTRDKSTPEAQPELGELIPYEDIAVIQRRYLPKSKRFEVSPNLGIVLNNAFYFLSSYGLTMGYNFTEHWGIEAGLGYVHNSIKRITKDLYSKKINLENVAHPSYFYDVSVKYSPAYGKLGFFKSKILPFDMYFSLGIGQNFLDLIVDAEEKLTYRSLNIASMKSFNLKLGGGMVFALSKNMAFKWDTSWRFYPVDFPDVKDECDEAMRQYRARNNSEPIGDPADPNEATRTGSNVQDRAGCPENPKDHEWWPLGGEVYFSIGFSFFFPDAGYR